MDAPEIPLCELTFARFQEKNRNMLNEIKKNAPGWVWQLAGLALAAGVFILAVRVPLSARLISLFSPFKLTHFLGLTLLSLLAFRLKDQKIAFTAGCLLAALAFALPLAIRLSSGLSNASVLGGFIPYKDGYYYYNGANMLLDGRPISGQGLQGAFRPLFPGLLSILLTLTSEHLLAALVMMIALTALAVYLAAACLNDHYGPLPAALFFTLNYAFIRPMIGDTLTEIPSLAFASLALVLLLRAARERSLPDAAWGGVMLVLAISIRAGAFFMLPFLILWLGWLLRGDKRFSWRAASIFGLILTAAFGAFNLLLPRLIADKSGATFGNFSWMLYGQAAGGAGFQYHLQALGTDDSAVVLQAALQKIHEYPLGLLIGFAKSYRDFFSNNSLGMFDLLAGEKAAWGWLLWSLCIAVLLYGLVRSIQEIRENRNQMLLAAFLGILVSIPFLPPIDGGSRFYSGSVPFLFALMCAQLPALGRPKQSLQTGSSNARLLRGAAAAISLLMVCAPALILRLSQPASVDTPACESGLIPFAARFTAGSYVDILPDRSPACGISPRVCLGQFAASGMDRDTDDFYNTLAAFSRETPAGMRLWAGLDYANDQYRFFILPVDISEGISAGSVFSGCAQKVQTQFQNVLRVVTIR